MPRRSSKSCGASDRGAGAPRTRALASESRQTCSSDARQFPCGICDVASGSTTHHARHSQTGARSTARMVKEQKAAHRKKRCEFHGGTRAPTLLTSCSSSAVRRSADAPRARASPGRPARGLGLGRCAPRQFGSRSGRARRRARRRPAMLGASQAAAVHMRRRARACARRRVRQICFRCARNRQRLPPRRRLPMAASRECARGARGVAHAHAGTAGGDHAAGASRGLTAEPLDAHRLRFAPDAPMHSAGVRRARAPRAPRRRRRDERPPTAGRAVERRGARVRRDAPPARGAAASRRFARRLPPPTWRTLAPAAAAGGSGLTILDVCSGSGLGAAVLSRVWPEARVVMLDSNREMDLTHVSERPNLDFHRARSLRQKRGRGAERRLGGRGHVASLGVHLCGALSPRLITPARTSRASTRFECRPAASRARSGARQAQREGARPPQLRRHPRDARGDGRPRARWPRRRAAPTRRRHAEPAEWLRPRLKTEIVTLDPTRSRRP